MTTEQKKELWGEDLFNVFETHIDEKGRLTSDWSEIIENEIPKFDKDYNDNELFTYTYSMMYNTDFEESEDGKLIIPTKVEFDDTPKRTFHVGEEIEHNKFGKGNIESVFEKEVDVIFDNGKNLKFKTNLFERNLAS